MDVFDTVWKLNNKFDHDEKESGQCVCVCVRKRVVEKGKETTEKIIHTK